MAPTVARDAVETVRLIAYGTKTGWPRSLLAQGIEAILPINYRYLADGQAATYSGQCC
jgi:hypothetical protein